jgi:signal transduction histidine kinase
MRTLSPPSAQPADPAPGGQHPLLVGLAFVAGYLLLDRVSFLYPVTGFNVTPWNPQPALAIALVMLRGQAWLPLVFATIAIAEHFIHHNPSLTTAVIVACVQALGYGGIAVLLTGRFRIAAALDTRSDMLRLTVVVAAGSLAVGMLYVAATMAAGGPAAAALTALLHFWIGDTVGILVTLPFILMTLDAARRRQFSAILANREAWLQALAILASLWVVFVLPATPAINHFYFLFLPLIWVVGRHGVAGAAMAALTIQLGVIASISLAPYNPVTVIELQSLFLALALVGFFLGVTVDEHQRIAAELAQSLRLAAASEMAASLAHELNQPLTALHNYARAATLLAADGGDRRTELVQTVDKMAAEAQRAAAVVRRLRDFFREHKRLREPADAVALLRETAATFEQRMALSGIHLIDRLTDRRTDAPATVMVDKVQLAVAFRNILSNAVDALEAAGGGTLQLTCRRDGSSLIFDFTDNGPGLSAGELTRLFEPFATTKVSGMGIGLAISRAIVREFDGRLWAEAGPGGRFHISLPALPT